MTLNFGALLLALMVEQPHIRTAMPNALRGFMEKILNARDSRRKLSVAVALLFSIARSTFFSTPTVATST
jgi:hypothetical protein